MPLHPDTRHCAEPFLPPLQTVPLRGNSDSSEGVPPDRAADGEEAHEWVQVDLLHRHAPLWRPRHHRILRQKVRPISLHLPCPPLHYPARVHSTTVTYFLCLCHRDSHSNLSHISTII